MPSRTIAGHMAFVVLALLSTVWGFLVGRWLALLVALPVALWIAFASEVDEVPPWFLGLAFGGVALVFVAAGVAGRRFLANDGRHRS